MVADSLEVRALSWTVGSKSSWNTSGWEGFEPKTQTLMTWMYQVINHLCFFNEKLALFFSALWLTWHTQEHKDGVCLRSRCGVVTSCYSVAIGYWLLPPETITDYFLCKDSFFWNHRETFMQSVTTAELRRDGNSLNHCYCCASGHLVILTCAEDVPVGSGLTDDLTSTCWASLVLTEALSSRYFRTTAFANIFFPKKHALGLRSLSSVKPLHGSLPLLYSQLF